MESHTAEEERTGSGNRERERMRGDRISQATIFVYNSFGKQRGLVRGVVRTLCGAASGCCLGRGSGRQAGKVGGR